MAAVPAHGDDLVNVDVGAVIQRKPTKDAPTFAVRSRLLSDHLPPIVALWDDAAFPALPFSPVEKLVNAQGGGRDGYRAPASIRSVCSPNGSSRRIRRRSSVKLAQAWQWNGGTPSTGSLTA